jgi:hypothetical protein
VPPTRAWAKHCRVEGWQQGRRPNLFCHRLRRRGLDGRVAGILIGFDSEDDWFDYQLEHDPRFLARIEKARNSARAGKGIRLEDLDKEL